ncbi:MAG: hypothetical protein ABIG11_09550 [bacterium]
MDYLVSQYDGAILYADSYIGKLLSVLDAQANLGFMYDNGQGVAQNHSEAARWYRKAAKQAFFYEGWGASHVYAVQERGKAAPTFEVYVRCLIKIYRKIIHKREVGLNTGH